MACGVLAACERSPGAPQSLRWAEAGPPLLLSAHLRHRSGDETTLASLLSSVEEKHLVCLRVRQRREQLAAHKALLAVRGGGSPSTAGQAALPAHLRCHRWLLPAAQSLRCWSGGTSGPAWPRAPACAPAAAATLGAAGALARLLCCALPLRCPRPWPRCRPAPAWRRCASPCERTPCPSWTV